MSVVDYWFDPICPWSWATSRWMVKVADAAEVEVRWHPMSLALLNATDQSPAAEFNAISIGPARVCAAVYAKEPAKLGELYTQLGTLFHHSGDWQEDGRALGFVALVSGYRANANTIRPKVVAALAASTLDPSYIDTLADPSFDDVLGDSHLTVPAGEQERQLIGVPTISVDGCAGLFGPVMSEVPEGDAVLEMWEAFATFARNPHFFELKRTTGRPAPLSTISAAASAR